MFWLQPIQCGGSHPQPSGMSHLWCSRLATSHLIHISIFIHIYTQRYWVYTFTLLRRRPYIYKHQVDQTKSKQFKVSDRPPNSLVARLCNLRKLLHDGGTKMRAVAKFSLSPLLRRDLCSSRSPHKRWNPNLAPNGVATLPPTGYKMLLPCEKTSLLIITNNASWVIWAVQKRVNRSRYQDVVVVFHCSCCRWSWRQIRDPTQRPPTLSTCDRSIPQVSVSWTLPPFASIGFIVFFAPCPFCRGMFENIGNAFLIFTKWMRYNRCTRWSVAAINRW